MISSEIGRYCRPGARPVPSPGGFFNVGGYFFDGLLLAHQKAVDWHSTKD
jgi:hypothetical protein